MAQAKPRVNQMMVDVTVIGAGMIGLSCALGLQQQGLRVALVERGLKPTAEAFPELRVSALNHRSRALLQQLGIWSQLPDARLGPYSGMQVWEQHSFAAIEFSAAAMGADDLGAIVENKVVEQALWEAAEQAGVVLYDETELERPVYEADSVRLNLTGPTGQTLLTSDYLIAADGVNSSVRRFAELPMTFWDYEQRGLVAVVRSEEPHGGIARQAFLATGPLALLPLADPHLCSIVWSCDIDLADELQALDDTAFAQRLTVASDGCLGLLGIESKRTAFPLRMQYAQRWVQDRLILVGDAAHSIHPLAGQGANLGFADVEALLTAFATAKESQKKNAMARELGRYQRSRKAAAVTMIAAMESFKRGFGSRQPLLKLLRGSAFLTADRVTPLKRLFAKIALGES